MSKLVFLLALSTACASPKPIGPDLPVKTSSDRDGDGLDDAHDKCPDQPEDCDGFEDDDGCPDLDDDKDGIPDTCDVCPRQPETFQGWGDTDGCPDSSADIHRFRDHPTHTYAAPIEFISFAAGSTAVPPAVLDQMAMNIRTDPRVEEITCIAQSTKTEAQPLSLSQKRASTICDGLSARGLGKVKIDGAFGVGTRPMRDLEQEKADDPRAMGIVLVMRADGHVIWKWNGTIVLRGETPPENVEPGPKDPKCTASWAPPPPPPPPGGCHALP